MKLEEKQVILKHLIASEGKIIVSKAKNEDGTPKIKAKEVYLAIGNTENDFEEIEEKEEIENEESLE